MLTSIPAASNSSVEMQRGGKWWIETPRLEVCRVAHLWAGCAPCQFCWDRSDRSDRWIRSAPMHTGLTGGVKAEPVELE